MLFECRIVRNFNLHVMEFHSPDSEAMLAPKEHLVIIANTRRWLDESLPQGQAFESRQYQSVLEVAIWDG
jgi:hypothetical protein